MTGPAISVAGSEWTAGDRVFAGHLTVELSDAGGDQLPLPGGTCGVVERVEPETGTLAVHFPGFGSYQFTADTIAAGSLEHGYATVGADAGAPHIDLHLLDLASTPDMQGWPEIEP